MHPTDVDWLLTDIDRLVTCDEQGRCISSGAVAIDKDTIVGVGPADQIRSRFCGRHTMDLGGFLVMPGLVNTHVHAAMSCFRGLSDDLPLMRWLHEVIFPVEACYVNPHLVYWGTLLSSVEMLKNGITTFCDGYFFEETAARAAFDIGIRAVLGQGILDFPSPDQPDPSRSQERVQAFLESFPKDRDGRIRPSLFCHAPYTCGPETLEWVKDLCRVRGILFQTHLSETASEVEELTKKHGERPVHYLDRLGILDEKTLLAHGVWLDESEIETLARRKTPISHAAESNMKLASGVAPVPALLGAGITVSLGTDGCASNNDLDIFSEMDKLAKLHKVFKADPVVCPASEVLKMATSNGAAALGMGCLIGSLEAGKKADLIAIDLNQPHLTPLYNPISHLVYAVKGSDVRHVWVNGRLVVSNGMLETADEAQLIKEVSAIARQVAKKVPEL